MKPAEQKAIRLLQKYNMYQLPVNVYELAHIMNIPVHLRVLEEDVSGVLVVNNGKATIGINANQHPNRQRFTTAHELGHFILHRPISGVFVDRTFRRDYTSSNGTTLEEIQANAFAAALLMPEELLRNEIGSLDLYDAEAVTNISEWLGVSEQALVIRLTRLGFISDY